MGGFSHVNKVSFGVATSAREYNSHYQNVGIRTGDVIENGRRLRAGSASKGRICWKSNNFC